MPQRRVRISLRLLHVDADALAGLRREPGVAPQILSSALDEGQADRLLERARVQDRLEFTTSNNQPVRLFWTPAPRWRILSVSPRVNGR